MSPIEIGLSMIAALIVLMVLRMPIFLAMALVGAAGYVLQIGSYPLLAYLRGNIVSLFVSYELSVVPLFLLMGAFASRARMTEALFTAANAFVGHKRGGLAHSAILGCGAFGAICGSSLATASTMATVALPQMKRFGYSDRLAAGTLAAGGTLGILIPPSVVLIIYAILTEQNIVHLFLAATVPGLLAVAGFMATVFLLSRRSGDAARADRLPWRARLAALGRVWHIVVIFLVVLGGIYLGAFTPTEGAAVGAVLTGAVAVVAGGLRWRGFASAAAETAGTTAMIFAILFGADLFNVALALSRLPDEMAAFIGGADVAPIVILGAILLIYLVLGCLMDSLSMILLTVPIIFPAFMALDFGLTAQHQALWFGVLTLIVVELGMITPPVGLNLFIIKMVAPQIESRDIMLGALPFVGMEICRVTILVLVPPLSFALVDLVAG
ncbi:TRAP transporter large permease [Acuticoccus kandeliae]|uniref:TRAP transporter large permease n=1 Tax=Acuticoccus kandeliae TaxID=2073160 RepID=UPI000D3EAD4B|nr:TRAP transporter large permease [Acuticoccus kandeliae]